MRMGLLITVLLVAIGCGASQGTSGSTPETQLAISVWPDGRGEGSATRWTLRCSPAAGTLPKPVASCGRLLEMTKPFAPLRKDLICTDIYGGPQQAIVTGTFKGNRIWVLLAARNGCEIARAKRLAFLTPGFSAAAGA